MKILWQPSEEQIARSNLTAFRRFLRDRHDVDLPVYADLHAWSVDHITEFWETVWDFCDVIGEKGDAVLETGDHMLDTRFCSRARLSQRERYGQVSCPSRAFRGS